MNTNTQIMLDEYVYQVREAAICEGWLRKATVKDDWLVMLEKCHQHCVDALAVARNLGLHENFVDDLALARGHKTLEENVTHYEHQLYLRKSGGAT